MEDTVKYMAIVNLTDNSFVSGDRMGTLSPSAVVEKVGEMLAIGADIIDVGACSTAPGNAPVAVSKEWDRFSAVLPELFSAYPEACFSIDSSHISVLRKAYGLALRYLDNPSEQFIVNDVSGAASPAILRFAAHNGLCYIAMCTGPDPEGFFKDFADKAAAAGLDKWILDPGFGFGKSIERNWEILRNLHSLKSFGVPVLCALSRKRMIYSPLGLTPDTCAEQSVEAERFAVSEGASIIRTHDLIPHLRR